MLERICKFLVSLLCDFLLHIQIMVLLSIQLDQPLVGSFYLAINTNWESLPRMKSLLVMLAPELGAFFNK